MVFEDSNRLDRAGVLPSASSASEPSVLERRDDIVDGLDAIIAHDRQGFTALRDDWGRLLAPQTGDVRGVDLTGGLDWTLANVDTHARNHDFTAICLRDGDSPKALLRVCRASSGRPVWRPREIFQIARLYSGRSGFLLAEWNADLLEAALSALGELLPRWDFFTVNVVDDGPSDRTLRKLVAAGRVSARRISDVESPYIEVGAGWEGYQAGLSSNFRKQLRRRQRRLTEAGEVRFREVRSVEEVPGFLDLLSEIERLSWKEQAGSSITTNEIQQRFYRLALPRFAELGWLYGNVLELDGLPIAYNLSLLADNVAYSLKASFRESHRELSPGVLLRWMHLQRMIEGGVRIYDMMGLAEDHKKQWSRQTYRQVTYALFNRGQRARFFNLGYRVRDSLRRRDEQAGD